MDLIVSHTSADFDAFGSLVAAKKLYPDSRLLLPGSQEKAVREFLSLVKDEIQIEKEATCDLKNIERLIIVDTRHKSRIGIASTLLEGAAVETHIYDHHPRTSNDIKADRDTFHEVGATVSILVDILKKKKPAVDITPLEATIMLLAIYEETGSLTYRTTTSLDVDTVSFLLSKGANLQAVSSYLKRKLTEEELTYLTTLIASTKVFNINGVNVAIAEGTIRGFVGELGTIVRKLQEVENFPVLFVLFNIKNRIRVIARSSFGDVDVNRILKSFGGAGHRSAASARIEGGDPRSFKNKLIQILKSNIKVKIFARDIMSTRVRSIPHDVSIIEAGRMLERLGLKGAPVMNRRKLVGMITTKDIKKAMKHRYGHASIKGYMSRNLVTVKPATPLHAIQKAMFEKKIGRIPVVKKKALMGLVTRTDVLKNVHREIFRKHAFSKNIYTRFNISSKMKRILPRQILNILRKIGREANRSGYRAFVVGGFVRDVLLGVKNIDLDIVIEGSAINFGKHLAKSLGGSLVTYSKFGTATVIIDWPRGLEGRGSSGFKIDLATARKESYEKPAALPTVEHSSLKNDLHRRDFTINAMAASLNKESFGRLIDFFGGEKDLENGIIRVLHDGSFIDDPTRIFRAVRFEQRFGFRIDKYTENLIKHAIREGMFSKTQDQRIRDEIMLILKEKVPLMAILRMKELHELRFIHKKIRIKKSTEVLFSRIAGVAGRFSSRAMRGKYPDQHIVYLMALLENLSVQELRAVCEKFVLRRIDREKLLSSRKRERTTLKNLKRMTRPSEIYRVLEGLSLEEQIFVAAKAGNKRIVSKIECFLMRYSKVKTRMRGDDLKKLGIKPGPLYSKLLKKVLYAVLDGKIRGKRDELKFIKEI